MNILIVDDMGYFRHNLARILEHHGHDVTMADSGADALQKFRVERNFDIIITDLMMRNMDGVELFIQIKALEGIDDTGSVKTPPFILLTTAKIGRPGTTGQIESRLRTAKTLGFAKIMFKPVDADELLNAVLELTSNTRSQFADLPVLLEQLHTATVAIVSSGNLAVAQIVLDRLEADVKTLHEFIASQKQVPVV